MWRERRREAAIGASGCVDLGSRGQSSGGDTATSPVGRWPFEDLDAAEHALLAVRTGAETGGQEGEEDLAVLSVLGAPR
jgi:hypothetical protein